MRLRTVHEIGRGASPIMLAAHQGASRPLVASPQDRASIPAVHASLVSPAVRRPSAPGATGAAAPNRSPPTSAPPRRGQRSGPHAGGSGWCRRAVVGGAIADYFLRAPYRPSHEGIMARLGFCGNSLPAAAGEESDCGFRPSFARRGGLRRVKLRNAE